VARAETPGDTDPETPECPADTELADPDPASTDPEIPAAGPTAATAAAVSPHAPSATAISLGTRINGSFHRPR